MHPLAAFILLALITFIPTPSSAAEPLVEQVRLAIDKGIAYLRTQENGQGSWDHGHAAEYPGGETALAVLALLTAGVKQDDPMLDRGLATLRRLSATKTYTVALQTMALAEAGHPEDLPVIQRNVDWLLKSRVYENRSFMGWGYPFPGFFVSQYDNSNVQYAVLGLNAGRAAGVVLDRSVWELIRGYYVNTQRGGGWGYSPLLGATPTLTMTNGGLCGLLISGTHLSEGREFLQADGRTAVNCGNYADNRSVAFAVEYVSRNFDLKRQEYPLYNLYGIERAGRLSGQRFFGPHDWYREGCEYLVASQRADGHWDEQSGSIAATSFGLLFLCKSRTPVLISKLVHGPVDRVSDDWNNDRDDLRHLVDYASKEVFKKQPLAWQVFNARRFAPKTDEDLNLLTRDLLQSPLLFLNGHFAPELTPTEKKLLRKYVEQGGFVLAEACCSHPGFDKGFRELAAELFPDNPLRELPPEHAVWRTHAEVPPTQFKLFGIDMGCKTVLVYSPQDLSCSWEGQTDTARGRLAFRLGGNIIAYATGLTPPKPRLTEPDVVDTVEPATRPPRGFLKVGQLRHGGDWQPAPRAMRTLLATLKKSARLDVDLRTEELRTTRADLLEYKLIYLHGRTAFTIPPSATRLLRANLETGGLLLADACCGKEAFDTAFRTFVRELFPDAKFERIPLNDDLFSRELNGTAIRTVRCRRERNDGGVAPEFRELAPYLEGVRINGQWAVIYSRYDLGCALESPSATGGDCLGHDHESALRLAGAAVLYALKR